jgi:hypothetical protein
MLETIVVLFAVAVGVAMLGLAFYAAHQADLNLERRIQDAGAGGRPLSADESAAVRARRLRPVVPGERGGSWVYLLVLGIVIAGIVIGQVVASALGIHGIARVLICSGAIYVVFWLVFGLVLLRKRAIATRRQ